ncbi:MAG: sodium:alanine symporter family protein [Oscillospiraceae bacterium]|nr:sodium:alanine symporter family protein [Oscillospiraceae bacterium]
MRQLLTTLSDYLRLDAITMILLLALGVYLTVRTRFFQVFRIPFIVKNTLGTLLAEDKDKPGKSISPFQAVTTALAGTMGVGNIAGVATALVSGGPGAVFWMWVSAFFGMATKYAEIFLAVRFRRKDGGGRYIGGPMYYMRDGLGRGKMAVIFSLLCVLCSFGIGNMTQVNSVSTAAQSAFSVPLWLSGLAVMICVALVVFGGVKRIARITELVIPFISVLYICFAGAFLFMHRALIGTAFSQIVTNAFGVDKAVGGVLGYTVSQAMRLGLSRGVFTNEAGLGSAPIAHAAADAKSPAHQGVWGIFEVFLDTIVVCTITALVLLTAGGGVLWQSGLDGAQLTSAAFESAFGVLGERFIALSIVFFAIPSMLGWCYYGESAVGFLSKGRKSAVNLYRFVFCLCIVAGAVGELKLVWAVSDVLNAAMAIPNIIAIFLLRREIKTP